MGNLGKMALGEQTKRFNGQDNVDTANKLLAQSSEEDYDILAQLGLSDHDLDAKLHSLGEYTRISNYSEKWGYCISGEVLEDIAFKYDLTLGKSKFYKYSVPITITSDIKEWTKVTGENVRDSDDFFILAPSESFYTNYEYDNIKKLEKKPLKKDGDPMLVYEIAGSEAEGGKVYSLITEWGSDLNKIRKIKGFAVRKAKTVTILAVLSIIFTVSGLVYIGVNGLTEGLVGNDWMTIIMTIISFIAIGITVNPLVNEIRAENIKKKEFNVYGRERNFNALKATEYDNYNKETVFKKYFGEITARLVLTSGIISIIFFLIMIGSGDPTFAKELAISNWYFLIPLGVSGLIFTVAITAKVFKNLKWG